MMSSIGLTLFRNTATRRVLPSSWNYRSGTESLRAFGSSIAVVNNSNVYDRSLSSSSSPSQQRTSMGRRFFSTADYLDDSSLVVTIMGPPNAGKSTLFNRLMCKEANRSYRLSSEKKQHRKVNSKSRVGNADPVSRHNVGGAIVSSVPGTTRDRRECIGRIGDVYFRLVDTAGVDGQRISHLHKSEQKRDEIEHGMMRQTLRATRHADLILLMFDAKVGGGYLTSDFVDTARWLQKQAHRREEDGHDDYRPSEVKIVANKLEGDRWAHDENSTVLENIEDAARLGFGEAIPLSAEHGEGMADLAVVIHQAKQKKMEFLKNKLQETLTVTDSDNPSSSPPSHPDTITPKTTNARPLQLAILGRQNVGKSTLVNSLLQRQRVITGATPGLTRDAISIEWQWHRRPVRLVDTAGIRRQKSRDDDVEDLAVRDAMRAMKTADVGVLVIDAGARMLLRQELAIADAVVREGRALVVVANKSDLVVKTDRNTPRDARYGLQDYADDVRNQVETRIPLLRQTPVIPMSSLTGEHVEDLMPVVFNARDRWERVVPTGLLNRWLRDATEQHPPPHPLKIKYVVQTKGRPPTFLLYCNNVEEIPQSYSRYLARSLQDTFQMFGMEVRMALKKSAVTNPYGGRKRETGTGVGGRTMRAKRMVKHLKKYGTKFKRGKRPKRKTGL